MTEKEKAFKSELAKLIIKYNASIGFDCGEGSDLYGVYDEEIIYSVDGGKSIPLANGYSIGKGDF